MVAERDLRLHGGLHMTLNEVVQMHAHRWNHPRRWSGVWWRFLVGRGPRNRLSFSTGSSPVRFSRIRKSSSRPAGQSLGSAGCSPAAIISSRFLSAFSMKRFPRLWESGTARLALITFVSHICHSHFWVFDYFFVFISSFCTLRLQRIHFPPRSSVESSQALRLNFACRIDLMMITFHCATSNSCLTMKLKQSFVLIFFC